ncbi:MAG: carbamoyltransferase C-terminal domain-containing protein, partial [Bacteroidota bacterium]
NDLEAIAFYDKPFLKFERLLETYYAFAPFGIRSFIKAMPIWLKEKLFLKQSLRKSLRQIDDLDTSKVKMLFPEHHLSHAASAFYPSPYEEAAILTIDGVGEWATASICMGKGRSISLLRELRFPHSLGLLYSAFTYYLGFRVNSGEYKLMGLAPYGNPESPQTHEYLAKIKEHLVDLKADGSIWLNQKHFQYATGLRMARHQSWESIFGFSRRAPESELEQKHCNLALAIQQFTEEVVIRMARTAKELTQARYLCMAGGVALNCVANGKLLKTGLFEAIFFQPASGDAGGAPGAAATAYHIFYQKERRLRLPDAMQASLLGPAFENHQVIAMARKFKAPYKQYDDFEVLCQEVAGELAEGKAVGWMQGRMEFGPRALGARSILGDPRNPEMQKKLNLKIKYRESFRPFAPSVMVEESQKYFDLDGPSPYMLEVQPVKTAIRHPLPDGYHDLPLREKLYFQRSTLPAITHIDFSARIQTVDRQHNPRYWQLIAAFKEKTGCGVVVNTSFNVRGEPIVCTPEDAYRCFMRTEMDILVIEDMVFRKEEQGNWEKDNWQEEFVLD